MEQLQNLNPVLQMLIVMSMFSLLPFMFCCMTSFLRFVIVLWFGIFALPRVHTLHIVDKAVGKLIVL